MKRGFTLVEMLVVVVVLVTLMTITFRLSSLGSDQTARGETISRMQRLENCLSGYYAAFGTYPPVKLHNSHDVTLQADEHSIQVDGDSRPLNLAWDVEKFRNGTHDDEEEDDWKQVKAVCLAQPLACNFPPDAEYDKYIDNLSKEFQRRANSSSDRYKSYRTDKFRNGFQNIMRNLGSLNDYDKDGGGRWNAMQIFRYGVMSFLLPRYLFMLHYDNKETRQLSSLQQWKDNNQLPCSPYNGQKMDWSDMTSARMKNAKNHAEVANIPSQAACARWLPNLKHICSVSFVRDPKFYGIDIKDPDGDGKGLRDSIFSLGKASAKGNGGPQYILGGITVLDGWGQAFYYYSPPPYQSYTLWSAGPNERTFPPWFDRKQYDSEKNVRIGVWVEDDIVHLSN